MNEKPEKSHEIATRKSPTRYIVVCSCVWSFETPRKQNAWARSSKISAAINRHRAALLPRHRKLTGEGQFRD